MSPPPPPPGASGAVLDDRLPLADRRLEADFESIYRTHRERVLRICRAILRHREDAEEAAQATMLSAYRAMARGDRPGMVGAWLAAIARNECRDLIGRRRVEVPLPEALPSVTSDPAEVVERRERVRELSRDIAELPRGQRTAIVLRGMAGMRHADIAQVVGGSEQAARTLVHEARESLAEFAEGRALSCADVRPRIDSGDGRALRARRVRAHLRVCDGCREAAGRRRGRLAGLIPVPAILTALRGLFAGAPAPIAGGAAVVSILTAGAIVVPGPWNPVSSGRADPPAPAPAVASPVAGAASTLTAPAAPPAANRASAAPGRARSAAPGPAAGAGPAEPPATAAAAPEPAAPAAGSGPPAASAPAGGGERAASAPAAGRSGGDAISVTVPGVSATVGSSGVRADVAGIGVSAGGDGVNVTSPPANVSIRPSTSGSPVPAVDASVPAVQLPRVSVPSATAPSVSTPQVTVPSVQVGPVRTPEVRVPSLSTPEVSTPAVTVPSQIATPEIGPVPGVTVDLEGTLRLRVGR